MADYDHSHIVPAGYLAAWAGDDGLLSVGWASGDREPKLLAPSVVGVRAGFYREALPDGSSVNRLDPEMSKVEGSALQIMRDIDNRWPLAGDQRGVVSEFLALQFMRSPAWKRWYGEAIDVASPRVRGDRPDRSPEDHDAAVEIMKSDSARHQRLVENLAPVGTTFANMHWTLLRCGRPRLATSDHPIVPVPTGETRVLPLAPVPPGGVLSTIEVRFALSPRHLLVMTWLDDYGPEPILKMTIDQVRNHNATVIEHAEVQWFHDPDAHPERNAGPWAPFAPELAGGRFQQQTNRWRYVQPMVVEMAEADEVDKTIKLVQWGVRQAA